MVQKLVRGEREKQKLLLLENVLREGGGTMMKPSGRIWGGEGRALYQVREKKKVCPWPFPTWERERTCISRKKQGVFKKRECYEISEFQEGKRTKISREVVQSGKKNCRRRAKH